MPVYPFKILITFLKPLVAKAICAATISHKILRHNPFFLKKYAHSPPPPHPTPPLFNVERVWKLFGIALMASWYIWQAQNLKSQHWNLCHNFCGWLSESEKLFWQGIFLSRCFQTFLSKVTNKLHTLHTASTGSPNLKRGVILRFYILTLSYNM